MVVVVVVVTPDGGVVGREGGEVVMAAAIVFCQTAPQGCEGRRDEATGKMMVVGTVDTDPFQGEREIEGDRNRETGRGGGGDVGEGDTA